MQKFLALAMYTMVDASHSLVIVQLRITLLRKPPGKLQLRDIVHHSTHEIQNQLAVCAGASQMLLNVSSRLLTVSIRKEWKLVLLGS